MNKNKGFIGIGLILAIILGIIVVGGGAYFLGKSNTKQEVKSPENVLPNNEDQNFKQIDNNQNPVVENNQKNCTPTSTPSIKVLSPNGGEVFTAGDKITVKWESCNVPATALITFALNGPVRWSDKTTNSDSLNLGTNGVSNLGYSIVTLPLSQIYTQRNGIITFGKNFKIYVGTAIEDQSYSTSDISDNLFTVNSGIVKSTIYNSKTFGYSIGYSGIDTNKVYVTGDGKSINLFPNQSNIDTLEVVDSSYVIPNYILSVGTVKFGENQFNKFKDKITSRHTYYLMSGLKNNKSIWISIENDSDLPNYLDLFSLKINL